MNLKRLFLYLLVGSVAVSALLGIGVMLFGNFGEFETKVLLTALTITVTSILGLACGAYFETGGNRALPIAGILFAVVSAIMWILMIWQGPFKNDYFVKTLMSATLLGAACSHVSLLLLARLDRRFQWSRVAVHLSVWSLSAFLIYLIWTIEGDISELAGRVIGVLSIIVAALTVVTPIFHKLSSEITKVDEIDARIEKLKTQIADLEKQRASAVEPKGVAAQV